MFPLLSMYKILILKTNCEDVNHKNNDQPAAGLVAFRASVKNLGPTKPTTSMHNVFNQERYNQSAGAVCQCLILEQ